MLVLPFWVTIGMMTGFMTDYLLISMKVER